MKKFDYEKTIEVLMNIIKEANKDYWDNNNENDVMADREYDAVCESHRFLSKLAGLEIYDSFSFIR